MKDIEILSEDDGVPDVSVSLPSEGFSYLPTYLNGDIG